MSGSNLLENEEKRRFVDLTVNEVSLVDSPANEEEFVIIKRQQEEEMTDGVKKAVEGKTEETPKIEEEENIKKSEEKTPEKIEDAAPSGTEDVAKKLDRISTLVEKLITPSPDVKVAEKKEEKKEEEKKVEKTAEPKSDDELEEEADLNVSKTLEVLVASIQKAKTFTPKRTAALKQAFDVIQTLLTDLAPATPAALAENLPTASIPVEGGVSSEVTKKLEEISSILESMTTVTKSLSERVEKVEGVRLPSNTVDEGSTEGKEVKTEKSLWSGLL